MVHFDQAASGHADSLTMDDVTFQRRKLGPDEGQVFQIHPSRPIEDLRQEALAASPPHESGQFRAPDLVDLASLDPAIHLDIRYATTNDFLGSPVYTQARAFLQRPAAEALVRALHRLQPYGYGLLIHDAYRPWYVTKIFWDATPPEGKIFVADPAQGSRHNRGCAVDLTLYELATGKPIEMPGTYDEMSPRSFPSYPGGTSLQRLHRDLLRRAMESEGFSVYESEWWHFDYKDWKEYPILNVPFEKLDSVLMHQAGRTDRVELLEGNIQDRVLLPVLVVEMPPFGFVDGEAFGFHGAAKQITVPALERGAAGIVGERSRRHFIVGAGHLDGLAAGEIVKREIHRAPAVVARTLRGIGDEDFAFGGSSLPEDFRDVPGTIGVVDKQTVAERLEFL